jgi:hypothetical protein
MNHFMNALTDLNNESSEDAPKAPESRGDEWDVPSETKREKSPTKAAESAELTMPPSLVGLGAFGEQLFGAFKDLIGQGIGEDTISAAVASALKDFENPKVTYQIAEMPPVDIDLKHGQLEHALNVLRVRKASGDALNLYLYGPAGSGKSTLCRQIADVFGLDVYVKGTVYDPTELTGYKAVDGTFIDTKFLQVFEFGGLFVWDEFDRSAADAIQVCNDALANGLLLMADGRTIKKHENCIIIATGNTAMLGSERGHIAERQDAAIRDRFYFILVDYDEKLELKLGADEAWTKHVQAIRAAVKRLHIDMDVTPRASIDGGMLVANGLSWADARNGLIFKGCDESTAKKVLSAVS